MKLKAKATLNRHRWCELAARAVPQIKSISSDVDEIDFDYKWQEKFITA